MLKMRRFLAFLGATELIRVIATGIDKNGIPWKGRSLLINWKGNDIKLRIKKYKKQTNKKKNLCVR